MRSKSMVTGDSSVCLFMLFKYKCSEMHDVKHPISVVWSCIFVFGCSDACLIPATASFWLRGAPQLCFGLIVNNAAGHRFSHLSRWTCKIPNEKNTLKSKRTIRVNFSLSKFYENRCHRSWSHCSTGLVPVHNIFFIGFSSQQKICRLKCLFEHFILQLPLAFKHGNSPSIPRIQARMQWCLCHFQRTVFNVLDMVKLMRNGEIGETSWSHLHVRRSLQHDHQKWNKLVKMLVIQEKLSQKFSMKSSYAVQSDTAKLLSFSSVNLCEISGSGVLLVEWTMWRQRPSTSSMSPTRPVFSRSFSMKGASSANPKLG